MDTDPLAAALTRLEEAAARRHYTFQQDQAALAELKQALRDADHARAALGKRRWVSRSDLIERSGLSRPTAYKLFN